MTSFALSQDSPFPSSIGPAIRPRAVHWLAALIVVAGISLPNCCLNGSHMFGAGMEAFGAICRAHS
jgi:hypothetical protein